MCEHAALLLNVLYLSGEGSFRGLHGGFYSAIMVTGLTLPIAALVGFVAGIGLTAVTRVLFRRYSGTLASRPLTADTGELHLRTAEALALAIEAKDRRTAGRIQRLQKCCLELAGQLKLPKAAVEAIRTAALLHDLGRLAVPEHIANRMERLSPEESEKMKAHPLAGAEILESLRFPESVVEIVRSHRERWDGRGYPDGLKGERIPLGARILAVVDFLETLAFNQRHPLSLNEAMNRVVEQSGKALDPWIVTSLQGCSAALEYIAESQNQMFLADIKGETRESAPDAAQVFSKYRQASFDSVAAAHNENQILFELYRDLGNSLSLDETLSVLSVRLKRLVPYDCMAAYVVRNGEVLPQYVTGNDFRVLSSLRLRMGEGLSGWVAQNQKPIVNGSPVAEITSADASSQFIGLRSAISIPLEGSVGVVGVLTLYHMVENIYTADHLRILRTISSKLAVCVENALAFQQVQNMAATDYLTELPNARSLFDQLDRELARCKRLKTSVTVMVCDLDGFKHINDRFGHLEGNRILRLFAVRLRASCREYDYVARMGGDEFVVVAPGLSTPAALSSGIRLSEVARATGREVCGEDLLSLSVGFAVYPDDGTDAEKLLAEADRRMYVEKQHHHNSRVAALPVFQPPQSCDAPEELLQ
jgi:diguanylate cyclase (GGDEF)-like protein/putative nucleotidyltransferase with HDIG domain